MTELTDREEVAAFADFGVKAFTTTRAAGDFGIPAQGPGPAERARWEALLDSLAPTQRLASARQVHGCRVVTHSGSWTGWRHVDAADGHVTASRQTALAVTVADCVPVFLAHESGIVGLLHAGWRGVADRMLDAGLDAMATLGATPAEVHVHLGPAISGRHYEVGPDVYRRLTGWETIRPRRVDLRALLAEQARARGVVHMSASASCTRDDAPRFYSHRGGDAGRQIAVIKLD